MIVEHGQEHEVLDYFSQLDAAALDTETMGLGWDDKMFSLILGDGENQFYFNFYDGEDHLGNKSPIILNELTTRIRIQNLFKRKDFVWFTHNAKFDLRRLNIAGIYIEGAIHDTEVQARVLRNDHMQYSLDAVAAREGFKKDDRVEQYIAEHKLFTMVDIPGKKTKDKNKHYYLVPFDIIVPYGLKDVEVTYKVGMRQLHALSQFQ